MVSLAAVAPTALVPCARSRGPLSNLPLVAVTVVLVWGLFQAAGVWRSVTSKSKRDEVRAALLAATALPLFPCTYETYENRHERDVTRLSMLQKDSGKARILESITDSRVAELFKRVDVNGARLLERIVCSVVCEVREQGAMLENFTVGCTIKIVYHAILCWAS